MDYNITVQDKDSYMPSDKRVRLSYHKYVGNECTELHIESGNHILTIQTGTHLPQHRTTVSHIIEFL